MELDPEKCQKLAEEMCLFDQPDDSMELHDLTDLLDLLLNMNPVRGVNFFHNENPQFNLQNALQAKPLDVLKAVGEMLQSGRWLETL